jgi:transposase
MSRQLLDFHPVREMVADGLPIMQICEKAGVCRATVEKYLKKHGLKARHQSAAPKSRDDKIISMHRQGVSMAKIASQYEVSRERVRQILARYGVTAKDGGGAVTKKKKTQTKLAARQAKCFAKYGVSLEVYKEASKSGLALAFRRQQNAAHGRGIGWDLRFGDWLTIWQESGKLELRGRGIGHYCMSRVNDSGGYELGNVHIQLCTENNSEFIIKNKGKRNANPGVYLMYPGLSRPWSAKVSKKHIGNFATEEEAIAARNEYLRTRPPVIRRGAAGRKYGPGGNGHLGRGLGYQRLPSGFKVMVGRKYLGIFKTEEAAIAARAAAIQNILNGAGA